MSDSRSRRDGIDLEEPTEAKTGIKPRKVYEGTRQFIEYLPAYVPVVESWYNNQVAGPLEIRACGKIRTISQADTGERRLTYCPWQSDKHGCPACHPAGVVRNPQRQSRVPSVPSQV